MRSSSYATGIAAGYTPTDIKGLSLAIAISSAPKLWADRLALTAWVGLTAGLSLTLARGPDELAGVWIGNGILTGWLLMRSTFQWPGYIAGAWLADLGIRLLSGDAAAGAFAISAANILEVLIVAGSVQRRVQNVSDPARWSYLGRVATVSTLVACVISGMFAAAVAARTDGSTFIANFVTWLAAHVVGMVIVATFTIVALREGRGLLVIPGQTRDFIGSIVLVGVVCLGVFSNPYPLFFLTYPPLLYAAFKHRFAGVVMGIALLTIIGTGATALGYGPLWHIDGMTPSRRMALLQIYIAAACLITFPVALAMAERKRLMRRVSESEQSYRLLADHSHDVIVRMRGDGQRLYVSPSAFEVLGRRPEEMLDTRWDLVHSDDLARLALVIARVRQTNRPEVGLYRMLHKDGHYIWAEASTRLIPSGDPNGTMDFIFSGRDVTERVDAERALEASRRELELLARVDPLTELPNRRQLDERLSLALTRLQRHGQPIALLFLDIDHFKAINDEHGHAAGDALLRAFAQRLISTVRSSDLVARVGGDEFVILLEDAAVPEAAERVARNVLEQMQEPIVEGMSFRVSTSIGIAFATHPLDASDLIVAADTALYAAKAAGRNTYRLQSATRLEQSAGAPVLEPLSS